MGPVRDALEQVLRGHEPYPALVIDAHWGLVAANRSLEPLLDGVAPHLLAFPVNVLRLTLHPEGLAPRIANLAEWRAHLLERLARDARGSGDAALAALHAELAAYAAPNATSALTASEVAVPLRIRHGGEELRFISTRTVFGSPVDVALAELSIEAFFPLDDSTRDYMRALGTG